MNHKKLLLRFFKVGFEDAGREERNKFLKVIDKASQEQARAIIKEMSHNQLLLAYERIKARSEK